MKPSEAWSCETCEWLDKAAEDLASAHVLIDSNHFSGALFFCQQAAEKSLKAFLTWHDRAFRRTHDLEELGKDRQAFDGTLAALPDARSALHPEREEAEAMFEIASPVLREVRSGLALDKGAPALEQES